MICVAATFAGIMVLHAVRSDIDPLRDVMSHYANGSRGPVMSVVFYAFGAAALALAFRLRTAIDHHGVLSVFPVLLALAGLSLIAAGVFEVDRPLAPQTMQETIHSNAAVAAFIMLIVADAAVLGRLLRRRTVVGAALGLARLRRHRRRRRGRDPAVGRHGLHGDRPADPGRRRHGLDGHGDRQRPPARVQCVVKAVLGSRWFQGALSLLVVVAIFGFFFPKVADYGACGTPSPR